MLDYSTTRAGEADRMLIPKVHIPVSSRPKILSACFSPVETFTKHSLTLPALRSPNNCTASSLKLLLLLSTTTATLSTMTHAQSTPDQSKSRGHQELNAPTNFWKCNFAAYPQQGCHPHAASCDLDSDTCVCSQNNNDKEQRTWSLQYQQLFKCVPPASLGQLCMSSGQCSSNALCYARDHLHDWRCACSPGYKQIGSY